MYAAHFGLRQRPFRATPDTDCYYPATSHERALATLLQAVRDDEGMALLTGEPGTGKTLLCHCLLDQLGPEMTSAFLTNSHFRDRAALLQAILYDLSLPYAGATEQELRLRLTDFLLKNFGEGRRSVLLIDEAQHLSPDLLEEIRLLGNLEARQGKALQVILSGQPDLLKTLGQPALASFSQRLVVRIQLDPMSIHEAADYLMHQLRAAGGRPEHILAEEAIEVLARDTHGVPRLLNQAAHNSLALACHAGATMVDAEAALEGLTQVGLRGNEDAPEADTPPPHLSRRKELPPGLLEPTRTRASAGVFQVNTYGAFAGAAIPMQPLRPMPAPSAEEELLEDAVNPQKSA